MRKILIALLLVALLVLFGGIVYSGVTIGNVSLGYSIPQIINKNAELDKSIAQLSTEIETNYELAKVNLDASFKKLQAEKQNYQSTIAYTTDEELKNANKMEQYKLDYLWTNLGIYATNNGVIMKADLSHGTSGIKDQYNISFTAIGQYLALSEFVYAIEKDPELGFRIDEFSLVPYSEDTLQATFLIKNVTIDPNSLSRSASVANGTVTNNPDQESKDNGQNNNNDNNNNNQNQDGEQAGS